LYSAFLTAEACADFTDAVSVHGDFRCFSIIDLFERAFHWVHDGLALLRAGLSTGVTTATAAEHVKQVSHAAVASATAFFDSIFTILVVEFTLFTI
jgi:hypothetical protein